MCETQEFISPDIWLSIDISVKSLPAALRAAQICLYFVYSEADFEVFRPAGATRCTDGGTPSVQRQGCRTPKIEIFTQI